MAYTRLGLVVFALELYSSTLGRVRVVLNPSTFTLPSATTYRVHFFVIATDSEDADKLATLFKRTTEMGPVFSCCLLYTRHHVSSCVCGVLDGRWAPGPTVWRQKFGRCATATVDCMLAVDRCRSTLSCRS